MFLSAENILHPFNSIVLLLPDMKTRLQRKMNNFSIIFLGEFIKTGLFWTHLIAYLKFFL
jgi:hypothetical protein